MNTIPTTSKSLRAPYTVVGGKKSDRNGKLVGPLSVLLLNRGGRPFKPTVFSDLEELKALEVLSIEGPASAYDVENLSHRFPNIRFLVLHRPVTDGEKVNMGIEECRGKFVLVIWNDMKSVSRSLSPRLMESIVRKDVLCTVPAMQNTRSEVLPTIETPAFHKKRLRVIPLQPSAEGAPSIFPFDYCGIYHKERFTLTGGFDHVLSNPYWQKLDFGYRSYMWGEQIVNNRSLRFTYQDRLPEENASRDESYKLFFLKNLAIRFNRDNGRLPRGSFLPYLLKSGGDFITAMREFREVRRWIDLNRYRFRLDARSVTELWEVPGE